MLSGRVCVINGDGETSRDFCYVANAVQANLRAAIAVEPEALNQVYNVAAGQRTTLNDLHRLLGAALQRSQTTLALEPPRYAAFRAGDVRHSLADVGKAQRLLGYQPSHDLASGLIEAAPWYVRRFAAAPSVAGGGRSPSLTAAQ
jgi:UDP-N-acetylglucosamine 4-epimerase